MPNMPNMPNMEDLFIRAPGLLAPGLPGWSEAGGVLTGAESWEPAALPKYELSFLSATERRRATPAIKLSLQVAHAATESFEETGNLCSIFACSGGDLDTLDKICTALTADGRPVSPAHFSNSVHNAPAGYWSIATGSRQVSTSICAYDATFTAGLLEAVTLASVEQRDVLLVAYDVPPPPALLPFRPLTAPFGVAMVLETKQTPASLAALQLRIDSNLTEDRMSDPGLEGLRLGNPAARCLPLISALARRRASAITLPWLPGSQIVVELQPC